MRLTPQPCFCGCGGTACYVEAGKAHLDPGSRYLPGHAPHERAPTRVPPPKQAGAAGLPYLNGGQGDLFGLGPARSKGGAR